MGESLDGWISISNLAFGTGAKKPIENPGQTERYRENVIMLERVPWSFEILQVLGAGKINDILQRVICSSHPSDKRISIRNTCRMSPEPTARLGKCGSFGEN